MKFKYGIGVISKNVVDVCIDYANKHNCNIILIPSRRQTDYKSGYANNWTTETLSSYVKSKTSNIFLKRDHGGPSQGQEKDDGILSLYYDCLYYDAIHIDPWKLAKDFENGCELTRKYIHYCYTINPKIQYEVGTEESIFPYNTEKLEYLLYYLKKFLSENQFNNIKFSVIQSGTNLKENQNTGNYKEQQLIDMVSVCKKYKLLSKEHNGDYLPTSLIFKKFSLGLDTINIAPEFGQIETQVYINEIKNSKLFDTYFNICYNSKKWEKWVDKSFDAINNKEKLINICGHYVLSQKNFLSDIKKNVRVDIDLVIKNKLTNKLNELYGYDKDNIL